MTLMTSAKQAAVIGFPIAQSKSPIIHRFWLQQLGLAGDYNRVEVAPDDLPNFMRALPSSGLSGVNITLPHKQAVMPLLGRLTQLAAAVGAVNAVIVQPDGMLLGHNTDVAGVVRPLHGQDWSGKTAVLIGNGGAARAIVAALKELGFMNVRCVARRVSASADLLQAFDLDPRGAFGFWQSQEALSDADLLINATSLGMIGQPPLEIDLSPLKPTATVFDIVYAPLETALLSAARRLGHPVIDGLEMLIGQAAEAFTLFYGTPPRRSAEEDMKLRELLAA
jgi:shikimate dehydrogenase